MLDGKKAQAIAIMMQKFKLPIEGLFKRILALKDLTDIDSGVDTLVACCPTLEEIQSVQAACEGEADASKFGKSEEYVIKVMQFPKLQQRLLNWQFMKGFDYELTKQRPCFFVSNKYFDFILDNKKF